ncbi:hypothetical protein, partial [Lachnobacterium bovis]
MIRGLKKKLLIGLLSATVVGTSLAPSVPLVGSFAQEVKAAVGEKVVAEDGTVYEEEAPATAVVDKYEWGTDNVYKLDGENYTKADTPTSATDTGVTIEEEPVGDAFSEDATYCTKNGDNYTKVDVTEGNFNEMKTTPNLYIVKTVQVNAKTIYKWSKEVTGKFVSENGENFDPAALPTDNITKDSVYPTSGNLYSKKTGASVATIKQSTNATQKGYSVKEKDTKVVLEKNKDETVQVTVTAGAGKVIKNVIAKILDSKGNEKQSLTATAV